MACVHPAACRTSVRKQGARLLPVVLSLAVLMVLGPFAHPCYGQAGSFGQWQTLPTQMPINPVHVTLMHNGKVLIVSGSGNLPSDTNFEAAIWDPSTDTVTTMPLTYDMFCNGMIELPDGRPFVISGTTQYDPFHGDLRSSIFNPLTGTFAQTQLMAHGRWYPTAVTLSNGSVMVFSGLDENSATNTTVEIYTVGVGWSQPFGAGWTPPLYPRLHLIPNGKVFYSGPSTSSAIFDPVAHTWQTGLATTNSSVTRTYGSSVLLPLLPSNNYKPVVMILGGGSPTATNTTELIDLSVANPAWSKGPAMSQPRIEMDAVILPSGKVLAVNGSGSDEDATTASLNADLYDPVGNKFSSAGQNTFARLYHSGALLLPDATVLVLGGNPQRGTYEPHLEIYTPAYLFNSSGGPATRPTISSVTSGPLGYGAPFQVQTPDAANISSAVLVRAGSPTHAFDMDQRLVGLTFTAGSGVLNLMTPPNSSIAPPGYYLLFILNSSGVPSLAQFVQLSLNPSDTPPAGTITSPSGNVGIGLGQSVTFAGTGTSPTGTIASYNWVFPGGNPSSSNLANPGAVTYSTPGTYVASLTVTDNQGVTDPNPPTVTVTVGSDFSISAAPGVQTIVPGGTATVNVAVTPVGSYTNNVTLSVSGLPSGVTSSFSPTSLPGSGSSTLTLTAAAGTALGSSTITVTGTSAPPSHSTTFTLNVSQSLPTANALGINFVGQGTPLGSAEVAGVVTMSNWNNATGASSTSAMSLLDDTGAATSATVTWTSDNTWSQPITDQPGNVRLMEGYLDNGNQDTSIVTVNGLPSNASGFSIYVYAQGSSNSSTLNTGIYQISGAGITTTSASLTYNSNFNGTFTQATTSNPIGNYVVLTIPNVNSFTLSAIPSTASSGYKRAPINAIEIVPNAPANPDFTITATPSSNTIGLSSSGTYTVTTTAAGGFNGTITLGASGFPSGAGATFNPATITGSGSSTMTVTTGSGTPIGSSTLTVTGSSGSLTHSTNVTLNVARPDFSISAAPGTASANPGANATYTLSVNPQFGFTDQVSFSASGLPTGASVGFNPSAVAPGTNSTMTITTAANTPPGSSTITITGTGTEGLTHTTTVTLTVTAPDFGIAIAPSTTSIVSGGTATYTATITPMNGFTGTVNLSVTAGLPSGASPTFTPASLASGNSTLTIPTLSSTATGSYTLTINGTSGALSHNVNATMNVTSSSSTNVISIDFVGLGTPMGSSEVAGVVPKANWNNAAGNKNTTPQGLVDETGTATTAAATWSSDDSWDEPITDAPGNVRMMKGYLDNGQQNTSTVTVTNLPPDPNGYAIYVYADGAAGGTNTGIYQITGAGIPTTSASLTYNANFSGTFTQSTTSNPVGNYVILTIPSASGFTLSAIPSTASSGFQRAPVNGIQIVPLGPPNPDFTIGLTPSSQTVAAGNSTTYTVSTTTLNSFSGTVSLAASGLPSGATPSFSPASIAAGGSSTLTVSTTAGEAASSGSFSVTGTSGTLNHSASATLNVVAPDFSISATPSTTQVAPGGSATYTVTIGALNGFTGTVNLAVSSGLPSGATPAFVPASITTSGSSTLTITTTAGTPTGSVILTIKGTGPTTTHSTSVTLNVTNAGLATNVISIDFVGLGTPMGATETAGVVPKTNWNNAGGNTSTAISLVDETGTLTNATVAWTSDNTWDQPITDAPGNVRMMKGYLDNGQQNTTTVTVSGLPSDPNGFNIYVYAQGSTGGSSDTGIYQISGSGITTTSQNLTYNANFNGTFTQATSTNAVGNYVILTIPNVSGFTLSAIPSTSTSPYKRAAVNGIQIVPR